MTRKHQTHMAPRADVEALMTEILGMPDMFGLQLISRLKSVTLLIKQLMGRQFSEDRLSLSRTKLLIRLMLAKRQGNEQGMLPSELSDDLDVSRNTISALLNGLEEQGFVERHIHPVDRRQFLIRITSKGEALIHARAPEVAGFVNELFSELSVEEQQTLRALLDRLYESLRARDESMKPTSPTKSGESL